MAARNGQQYLERLNGTRREVWIGGEKVTTNVADHPAFRGITRSIAALYDMQHDPALAGEMTYTSPTSGQPVGLSFLQPRTQADLVRRHKAIYNWARHSGGMMGRSADYLNSSIMAMASAGEFFAQADPGYAKNVQAYYELCREQDLVATHTLINPQANRAVHTHQQADPFLAARIVRETDRGVIIRGARMLATLGAVSDEIMVFPSTLLRAVPEDEPYSYAFAIPCDMPGLKFICRESFDLGKHPFDHPLGSRFEEMDCVVVFDDVEVPYERIFMLGHPELCNKLYAETGAVVHMAHQVMVKNIAKTEFLLGLIALLVDGVGIDGFQHVQEKVAEVIIALETLKAMVRAAEADAAPNRWGLMTPAWGPINAGRNWYPRTYPRLVEIIQQLGASGLMALPGAADFANDELRPDLEKYLQGRSLDGEARVRLFRLAWDVACSSFGQRQVLYERFFFGDPVRMAGALYQGYDKQPHMAYVREFLARSGAVGAAGAGGAGAAGVGGGAAGAGVPGVVGGAAGVGAPGVGGPGHVAGGRQE
jgi:4-hydroxyphenylacetate 3-monooxygenase